MCERKENEPFWAYVCRWIVEQPKAVLALVGIAAAVVLYLDLRTFIGEQAKAQQETMVILTEIRLRLEHIEKKMD